MRDFSCMTLAQAQKACGEGSMLVEEYRAYAHAWQTGAIRLSLRACHCAECVANFPSDEYQVDHYQLWHGGY